MRKKMLVLIVMVLSMTIVKAQTHRLRFVTPMGDFHVMLYDFTPKHRDLMLRAVQDSVYHQALFNRIIEGFVVQGGEHDVDIAKREAQFPDQPKARLAPEFDKQAFHKIGALGAGRDNNPEKSSFLNQIYFVVGKAEAISEAYLDSLERKKGFAFTHRQRMVYTRDGGLPRLDQDYTVFGEVYEGIDVLLTISKVRTDHSNFPIQSIPFSVFHIGPKP